MRTIKRTFESKNVDVDDKTIISNVKTFDMDNKTEILE